MQHTSALMLVMPACFSLSDWAPLGTSDTSTRLLVPVGAVWCSVLLAICNRTAGILKARLFMYPQVNVV